MEYEENVVSEYYTDYILKSFKFTIYDENNNVVGTISDLVHYEADEVRAVACDPVPVMTQFLQCHGRLRVRDRTGSKHKDSGLQPLQDGGLLS